MGRFSVIMALLVMCLPEAASFSAVPGSNLGLALRSSRQPWKLGLCMSAEAPAKVVVCTGPTCSQKGGKKALQVSLTGYSEELCSAGSIPLRSGFVLSRAMELAMHDSVGNIVSLFLVLFAMT